MLRVVRVLAPNAGPFTLEGTNTWIVGADPAVVVDPGPDDAGHVEAVARVAGRVGAILLTHRHPDHAPAAARLSDATGAPVLAYRPEAGETLLRDGQVLEFGTGRIRTVHTPGHTPDHVAFLLEGAGALLTGDAVLGRGTSIVDPSEGDLAQYLRSLRRMRDLRPRTLYPGHGPTVFDGMAKLEEYLAHRLLREEQVLAALRDGKRTAAEMVPEIYADYPSELHGFAARQLLAHLLKLQREGVVERVGHGPAEEDSAFEPRQARSCERCGRPVAGRVRLCRRCSLDLLQEGPGAGREG